MYSSDATERGDGPVDYTDQLRRLAINDAAFAEECLRDEVEFKELDPTALALCRLAALVAVGGDESSFGAQADAAVSAGASPAEIVEVLVAVVRVVGLPRAVAAAPNLAMALGYDIEDALEHQSGG